LGTRIETNRFRVSFAGNSMTSRETVERYLLFRAAEITLQQGYDGFEMADRSTERHSNTYVDRLFGALREGLQLKAMLERVSQALGNTPSIARKTYVHPLLIEHAKSGNLLDRKLPRATRFHSREECSLIEFLREAAAADETEFKPSA
jgi:hypothetical protein